LHEIGTYKNIFKRKSKNANKMTKKEGNNVNPAAKQVPSGA